jgi:hypothetical protein
MLRKFKIEPEAGVGEPIADHSIISTIKGWIEKRISFRRQVNARVLILQGTQVRSGELLDISAHGFGLDKVPGLIEDELISIATQNGHVLEGRVVWVNGGRAGVSLISES